MSFVWDAVQGFFICWEYIYKLIYNYGRFFWHNFKKELRS